MDFRRKKIILDIFLYDSLVEVFLTILKVDAYREAGKEEAASRLDDQLTLIHTRFQVGHSHIR